jgi:uncharacterized repeat protein (TIGR03803 family)
MKNSMGNDSTNLIGAASLVSLMTLAASGGLPVLGKFFFQPHGEEVNPMQSKEQFHKLISRTILRAATVAVAIATVFALVTILTQSAQAQTFTVLYTFTGGADGAYPYAGLTMDRGGNLYGTTQFLGGNGCGGFGCGTVFRLKHAGPGWILNPLYSFQGGPNDGASPLARVIIGPDGSLYGTTSGGGAPGCSFQGSEGCGTVFNLKPPPAACKTALCPWTETVLYRFTGGSDGANPQNGALLIAPSGVIYGTTVQGGAYGYGVVFSLTPTSGGWTYSVIYSFTGGFDGAGPYSGVILDNKGNLYGTTPGGGWYGLGAVYELMPAGSGWQEKLLWSFTGTRQDGWGITPVGGLIFDGSGNLYGTTENNYFQPPGGGVFELSPSDGSWTIAHAVGVSGSSGPVDSLAMDTAGNLYGTLPLETKGEGGGEIFELHNNWTTLTDLHGWPGYGPAYGGPILDANGNLYGTNAGAGQYDDGLVWEITP